MKLRSAPVRNSTGPSGVPTNPPLERARLGDSTAPTRIDERLPLCLAANRGRLGLELCEPVEMGPIVIEKLVLTFENLRFPLDLSGGVPAFRHRRGELQRITISLTLERLKRWLDPRVRSVMGALDRPLDLWFTATGLGFGWVHATEIITGELHWVPQGGDARVVLDNVRGSVPAQPALARAICVLDGALSGKFSREGRTWSCRQVGQRVSRVLLPAAGARAPAADAVNFGLLSPDVDGVKIELDAHIHENELSAVAIRALEFAELVSRGDEALIKGQLEHAREEYVRALEQAPRHRELALLIAELDSCAGGREHAAMGLLNETMPAISAGRVGAELLEALGDRRGALEAYDTAARSERYPPLRALLQLRKANLELDAAEKLRTLDEAVAAAPTLTRSRWVRFEARARRGDMDGALADAEFLETCTSGSRAKFDVCLRCGTLMLDAGLSQQSARFFERALRYRPDSCSAAVGLARAFVSVGQPLRAVTLLERALSKASSKGQSEPSAQLLLACLVAKEAADLPQSIARVRQIPSTADVAVEARLWEARWRHSLGDIVGASVAWARMRELVELGQRPHRVSEWLQEAGLFERDVRKDLLSAERHLSVALRVSPHEPRINTLYREVAAAVAASTTFNEGGTVEPQ